MCWYLGLREQCGYVDGYPGLREQRAHKDQYSLVVISLQSLSTGFPTAPGSWVRVKVETYSSFLSRIMAPSGLHWWQIPTQVKSSLFRPLLPKTSSNAFNKSGTSFPSPATFRSSTCLTCIRTSLPITRYRSHALLRTLGLLTTDWGLF